MTTIDNNPGSGAFRPSHDESAPSLDAQDRQTHRTLGIPAETGLRWALYARGAAAARTHGGAHCSAVEVQIRMMRNALTRIDPDAGELHVFTDEGRGGNRPAARLGLTRVRELVRSGHIDAVIFSRMNRLSHDPIEVSELLDEFVAAGTTLATLDGVLDSQTIAQARMLARIERSDRASLASPPVWSNWVISERRARGTLTPLGVLEKAR